MMASQSLERTKRQLFQDNSSIEFSKRLNVKIVNKWRERSNILIGTFCPEEIFLK